MNSEERNFEYFLTIVKYQNLTKAANALYVTQPTLSKYLGKLEESLGAQLLDRATTPLQLTDAGRCYLAHIEQLSRMQQQLKEDLAEIQADCRGTVTMGISAWRGSIVLPAVLPAFHKKYPAIRVDILEGRSYAFESAMLDNRADFCVVTIPSNFGFATTYETLGREPLYLAGNREHPLVREALRQPPEENGLRRFAPQWLEGTRFITTKEGQILTKTVGAFMARYNITPGELWATENIATAIDLVDSTDYFTIVPAVCTRARALPPNLVFFNIGEPPMEWEMALVYKKGARVKKAARLFMEEVKAFYSQYTL